jgi:NADH:ubiquinone oxidoreductase subunit 5 (subunit L)/multisubunit Na+/H+ antiporter MnhA subunit
MPIYSADLSPVHPVSFLWALPALPAAAAATLALAGGALERRFGPRARAAVAVAAAGAAAGVALAALGVVVSRPDGARLLVDAPAGLVDTGFVTVRAALALDLGTAALALAVSVVGVGALVAGTGGGGAGREARLSTCLAGALLVVLADNFALALVGWELLALGVLVLGAAGAPAADGEASRRGVEALVVNRAGQAAWLGGVVLLLWGLGGGVAAGGPRTVTVDARGVPGADIELRTLGDRATVASVRQVPVGPTLAPRAVATTLALQDSASRHPFEESLRDRRVGPASLLALACLGFLLGAIGLAAAATLAHGGGVPTRRGAGPVEAVVATTVGASCVCLLARVWFLFELTPALEAAALASAGLALFAVGLGGRRAVVPWIRRALRELGVLPARDFARAAEWLDRRVLGLAGGALALAALVALAAVVVRR